MQPREQINSPSLKPKICWETFAVFSAFFLYLSLLARSHWFWTDEGYTVNRQFDLTIFDYLFRDTGEGTSAPLFFLLERFLLKLMEWLPIPGMDWIWFVRLIAILPFSLLAALVYKACRQPKISFQWIFPLGLMVALASTSAFEGYGWQARPYGLWALASFLFSQQLLVCLMNEEREISFRGLVLSVYFLLPITPFAFFQIGGALCLLPLFTKRPWKEYIKPLLWMLPILAYGAFCVLRAPSFTFMWPGLKGFSTLVAAHGKYWLVAILFLFWFWQKNPSVRKKTLAYFFYCGAIVALVMAIFYLKQNPRGFEISNRYFIFLLPAILALLAQLLEKVVIEKSAVLVSRVSVILGVLLLFLGIYKGSPALTWAWHEAGTPKRVSDAGWNEAFPLTAPKHCLCLDIRDPKTPEINGWGVYSLHLRRWNSGQPECTEYQPITFLLEDKILNKVIVNDTALVPASSLLGIECSSYRKPD